MYSHPSRLLRALLIVAASGAAGVGAHANPAWTATRTHALYLGTLRAGAAVQPGHVLHVVVSLRLRDQAGLDAITEALTTGRSTRHIDSAEFLSRFAPAAADAEAVAAHLRTAGFTNVTIAKNRLIISADGTAATAKAAFNADLRQVAIDGRNAFANVTDVQVPAHLAGIVNGVKGLQTVYLPRVQLTRVDPIANVRRPGTAAGDIVPHQLTEFETIYDAAALPTGAKTTVGIIASGDISQTLLDVPFWAGERGIAAPAIEQVVVGTPGAPDANSTVEWDLDGETSVAAAGGELQKIVYYVGTKLDGPSLTEAYNQAVSDNVAKIVNVSIGGCETGNDEATDDPIFQTAVAQGQTFTVASGDSGAYTCGTKNGGVSYPASSPYVVAVGGTQIQTANQTTWVAETGWSCSSFLNCFQLFGIHGGSGGGASKVEKAPTWQLSSGVLGASQMRGVPDIAFDADFDSGGLMYANGLHYQVAGTSMAAPMFMGFWARMQSKHGNTLPFPSSSLYKYGVQKTYAAKMFHDITAGNNGGQAAAAGWDYVTGFGSLDVGQFSALVDKLVDK
jgi:pseudomonalisin